MTVHRPGATCTERRPCRTCSPQHYACPGCGTTVTACHRAGGHCCTDCPHTSQKETR